MQAEHVEGSELRQAELLSAENSYLLTGSHPPGPDPPRRHPGCIGGGQRTGYQIPPTAESWR